jgi:tetratricopeptide (TPR) repeat protein
MRVKYLAVAAIAATAAVASIVAVVPSPAAAQAFESGSRAELYRRNILAGKDVQCRTNASCAALGVAALDAGRINDAQTLVDMEAMLADAATLQAEEENSPKALISANARVAMALVHEGDVQAKLGVFQDARAYYKTAIGRAKDSPDDMVLSRVIAVAQQRLTSVADKQVVDGLPTTGVHFARYQNLGAWSTVTLTPVKGRRGVYRLQADLIDPSVNRDGQPVANTGTLTANVRFYGAIARIVVSEPPGATLDGTARISNVSAYDGRHDKCLLEFRLTEPETLDVATHGAAGACGFGAKVTADGRYYLRTGS